MKKIKKKFLYKTKKNSLKKTKKLNLNPYPGLKKTLKRTKKKEKFERLQCCEKCLKFPVIDTSYYCI